MSGQEDAFKKYIEFMYNGSGITNSSRHAKTLTGVKGYGSNSSSYREEFGLGQNDAEQQMFYTHKYKYQTSLLQRL